jgi:hypothetical protein
MHFFKKKTNYGKIIAVSIAVVAAASAIAFVVYKLIKKYQDDIAYDCDDLLDDCDCCDCDLELDEADDAEVVAE